ncbi:NAD(P)/FAD-dependent oxidoreductase [Sinomonas flava]|uniref:NAD(P)/FAD-dependent oxidoreductase n=1 Tax=Sinomonas flava TaxID=496857 RepID=A0ABP5NV87_9MICC
MGHESHEAVIVGGGAVGLCFGVLLAQAGVDVVVLEARHEPGRHSRAIGIHPPGLRVLARAGVAEGLAAAGVLIGEGVARSGGRGVARVGFNPGVLAVPQWRTEEALEGRLAVVAPGALRRGVRAAAVERAEGGAVVRTATGEAFRGAWVIAADGARSPLRTALAIPVREQALPDAYLMGDFADTTGDGTRAVLHLEPEGIVESFPLPGGVRRWVAHLDAPEEAANPARLAQVIGERTGEEVVTASCTMLSAFTVAERLAGRMRQGPVLLVGDAAHEVSPIGGQGMTLGWLDAEAFAPLVAADVRERRRDPGQADGWPELWGAAEHGRLAAAAAAARQARLNMALGRPLPPRLMAARNAAFRALYRAPLARNRTAARFTMQA